MGRAPAERADVALRTWGPHVARLTAWGQTAEDRIPDADAASRLLDRIGIATVYPASSEVADLFHAHVGDPDAKTDAKWDSPSGRVYAWRWDLGRKKAAFYGTVIRKRPTFIAWPLLPSILRLVADLRTPDELFDFGIISNDAYRIAQVLDGAGEPVGTAEIRKQAGFPTGKEQRAAYHKGLAELEHRLLVTSEFAENDAEGTKHHGLMFIRHRDHLEAAERMTREEALDSFLRAYLPAGRYVLPVPLARHLGVDPRDLIASLRRLSDQGIVREEQEAAAKAPCYVAVAG